VSDVLDWIVVDYTFQSRNQSNRKDMKAAMSAPLPHPAKLK
jgi:hypothetical protein